LFPPIQLYEPLVVGKFCEARDPYLAYIAHAKGFCNDELIAIINDNSMFKQQARYLVKRRYLIDQVSPSTLPIHNDWWFGQIIATALPECTDPDDVSITVKAFLSADLLIELIELLEEIIIEPSPFSDNQNLQNLLLLTAIRAEKGKVVGYITNWRITTPERLPKLPPITIFTRKRWRFTRNTISMGWLSMFSSRSDKFPRWLKRVSWALPRFARWPGLLGCPSSVRSTAFALFEMAFSSTLYPLIVV
jgi:hypothetical protein